MVKVLQNPELAWLGKTLNLYLSCIVFNILYDFTINMFIGFFFTVFVYS